MRDEPVVSFTRKDRVLAEGASTALAEKLIGAFRRKSLPVHQFQPVRTHVIRAGREWVPAVLRYNKIPNRVLFELSNLSNDEDRESTLTGAFRQRSAEALADGLVTFFGGAGSEKDEAPATVVAAQRPADARGGIVGPWPEIAGPWPRIAGPWPPDPQAASRATRAPAPKPTRTATPKPSRRRRKLA